MTNNTNARITDHHFLVNMSKEYTPFREVPYLLRDSMHLKKFLLWYLEVIDYD